MPEPRYERIGVGYASTRREDPALRKRIDAALGDAATVLNVGAGTGLYEPLERHVIAIEPSDVMAAQRPRELAPAIRASAGNLPLRDDAVDASMTVLSVHHWDAEQEQGVRELRRVTRGPVVIVTFDPCVSSQMWLARDYLPEVAALDRAIFPSIEQLTRWLDGTVEVQVVPTSRGTEDWTFAAFWAHPERVMDAQARRGTSGWSRMAPEVARRAVDAIGADLKSGAWDVRNGQLRQLSEFDAGMRLVVAR
jgi:SAM-dependent methyltransferase